MLHFEEARNALKIGVAITCTEARIPNVAQRVRKCDGRGALFFISFLLADRFHSCIHNELKALVVIVR